MRYGDIVLWRYTHHTNGRTSFIREKQGEFLASCRHTVRHWRKIGARQMAYVKFEGNKTYSLVPLDELKLKDLG